MRSLLTPIILGCVLLAAAPPPGAHAQTLLWDYVGFDYESPDLNASTFGEVGSGYQSLGLVEQLFSPLVPDTANFAYTYEITGLTSVLVTPFGADFIVVNYSAPGTINIYEDSKGSGTLADFGVNPPNGTAPSTFTDGTLFLAGEVTNFRIVLNTTNGTGSFEAVYEITGGSQLSNVPLSLRQGWTFAGSTTNATNIPVGYDHQIDGQVFVEEVVNSRTSSWGRLKAIYR